MPAPLFPYVWQYNNQPIEVLAQEIVNIVSGSGSGPVNTANYIPVSNGLTFQDSVINTVDIGNNPVLETLFPVYGSKGFLIQPVVDRYTFGECEVSPTGFAGKVVVDNQNEYAAIYGESTLSSCAVGVSINGIMLDGPVSLSTSGASGSYLQINVNNIPYLIELLNP